MKGRENGRNSEKGRENANDYVCWPQWNSRTNGKALVLSLALDPLGMTASEKTMRAIVQDAGDFGGVCLRLVCFGLEEGSNWRGSTRDQMTDREGGAIELQA